MLGLSLNLIVGYAGLFQLGHAAFYALGAYTAGILNLRLGVPLLLTLPACLVVAGLFGFLITRPILHLRGDYLCIVTIAFGEVVRLALVNNVFGLTGGANGLSGIARPRLRGLRDARANLPLLPDAPRPAAHPGRHAAAAGLALRPRAGLFVREDEEAAEAMGIDTTRVKLLAFVIGSAVGRAGRRALRREAHGHLARPGEVHGVGRPLLHRGAGRLRARSRASSSARSAW